MEIRLPDGMVTGRLPISASRNSSTVAGRSSGCKAIPHRMAFSVRAETAGLISRMRSKEFGSMNRWRAWASPRCSRAAALT